MNYHALVESIVALHQESSGRAALAVNRWLILRNWVIGAHLVEFEQNGEDRAKYGAKLLAQPAHDLKHRSVSGSSAEKLGPSSAMTNSSRGAPAPLPAENSLRLSWTHWIELLHLDDPWKRAFYENECLKGNMAW